MLQEVANGLRGNAVLAEADALDQVRWDYGARMDVPADGIGAQTHLRGELRRGQPEDGLAWTHDHTSIALGDDGWQPEDRE